MVQGLHAIELSALYRIQNRRAPFPISRRSDTLPSSPHRRHSVCGFLCRITLNYSKSIFFPSFLKTTRSAMLVIQTAQLRLTMPHGHVRLVITEIPSAPNPTDHFSPQYSSP